MSAPLAYTFDKDGYFCGTTRRQKDPMAKDGSYLMPGNSTDKRPPARAGHRAKMVNGKWQLEKITVPKTPEERKTDPRVEKMEKFRAHRIEEILKEKGLEELVEVFHYLLDRAR